MEEPKIPAVLLLVFNRPKKTEQVFEAIREVKPSKLYVAADGPRTNVSAEDGHCAKVREICNKVDWPCEVTRLYRERNLGCRVAVSDAISWFFNAEEEGIILEDDCVPSSSFFSFCQDLLERYKHDERIMHISGLNWQDGKWRGEGDYYFSKYPGIWGWATWRDRWDKYDLELTDFYDFIKARRIEKITENWKEQQYHLNGFIDCISKTVDTWDIQWKYSVFNDSGICIFPNVNLITNIGFGTGATHTVDEGNWRSMRERFDFQSSVLRHPSEVIIDKAADEYMANRIFTPPGTIVLPAKELIHQLFMRVVEKMKKVFNG